MVLVTEEQGGIRVDSTGLEMRQLQRALADELEVGWTEAAKKLEMGKQLEKGKLRRSL